METPKNAVLGADVVFWRDRGGAAQLIVPTLVSLYLPTNILIAFFFVELDRGDCYNTGGLPPESRTHIDPMEGQM